MKKKIKVLCFLAFGLFSMSWLALQEDPFVFQRGNQKLQLLLENGKKHLNWNQKTVLTLHYKNVRPDKLALSAPGLRLLRNNDIDSILTMEITPLKKAIKKDTLTLYLRGWDAKDSVWMHHFSILIKDKD